MLESPQTIQATDCCWLCARTGGKTLLLKEPHVHALTVGHGEIKVDLNWKLPPCWLALLLPKGALQTSKGEPSLKFLLGYRPCVLKHQHARQDAPAHTVVARLLWVVGSPAFPLNLRRMEDRVGTSKGPFL